MRRRIIVKQGTENAEQKSFHSTSARTGKDNQRILLFHHKRRSPVKGSALTISREEYTDESIAFIIIRVWTSPQFRNSWRTAYKPKQKLPQCLGITFLTPLAGTFKHQ